MHKTVAVLLSATCAVTVSSCASLNANSLPEPGGTYRGGYDIVLEFANVLNLPDRAKVVMDGTAIGVVEGVAAGASDVEVTARIDPAVQVPSNISAVLQQATVLGDIYVSLNRPAVAGGGGAPLPAGGRIPVAQTTSPSQLEDTLANLANFVASGSIQRVQSAIININWVTPARAGQVREIASRVSRDLADLSNNIDTVDKWLNGISDTGNVLASRVPQIQFFFSPAGMTGIDRVTQAYVAVGTLLPSIGSIYTGGFWLVPLLKSLGVAVGAVQQSKVAIEGEYPAWRQLFTDMFLPQDKYPAMNITSVETADGRDITGRTQDILRMLGATP
ncbi:MlaD family protein [Mycolicibacterium hodleri]|uniref:MCE family protein n=1 Tax=Mycolicibacterium hodleri TaxID=49897 RepID=A0A502E6C3_9MYCO|nr:MlaD family protein [Mycolicibacterium hodleri]TPG32904.1 MCE family protein [Mycolicibacterium hodleri]